MCHRMTAMLHAEKRIARVSGRTRRGHDTVVHAHLDILFCSRPSDGCRLAAPRRLGASRIRRLGRVSVSVAAGDGLSVAQLAAANGLSPAPSSSPAHAGDPAAVSSSTRRGAKAPLTPPSSRPAPAAMRPARRHPECDRRPPRRERELARRRQRPGLRRRLRCRARRCTARRPARPRRRRRSRPAPGLATWSSPGDTRGDRGAHGTA